MNKTDEESMDYISRLPESVIHHILSFLPFNHIVRTSVLSKAWNRVWSNYPNIDLMLNFGMFDCPRPLFLFFFERVMDQCLFRKDCVQKLELSIIFPVLDELAPFLDRWLGAAIERNVSELVIKIHSWMDLVDGPNSLYYVPEGVGAGSLKVLEIERCKFEDRHACIELPHLRKLTLNWCRFFGEDLLNKILGGCPLLEFLDVSFCEGVGHVLSVLSKPLLKYFNVCHVKELARIEVFTPSLETFKYSSLKPCAIDLASCTVLKFLELGGAHLSTDYVPIQDLLSKLLCIEELQLRNCRVADKIEISSSCLNKLVVIDYINFPGAEIDVPNLLHLDFSVMGACNSRSKFSSWNLPKVEEIHMAFSVQSFRAVGRAELKGFLKKLHNYENLKLLIACKGLQVNFHFFILLSSKFK